MPKASNGHAVETILRTVTTEMGSRSGVSMAPLKRVLCQEYGKLPERSKIRLVRLRESGVVRSVSQAWRIGRAIALCRTRNELRRIPQAILELQNGSRLFVGKIMNVNRVNVSLWRCI